MRAICQGDVFRYINEELRITQKDMCIIFNKVREGNMTETRISEIKQGRRKGYRGLKSAASLCYAEYFQQQDPDFMFSNLRRFLEKEDLCFPDFDKQEENFESYALRFLEFGQLPVSTGAGARSPSIFCIIQGNRRNALIGGAGFLNFFE